MKTQVLQNSDFRSYLKRELDQRCKNNPAYSLRAFARQLQVSHAALSQILSGKRPLTAKTRKRMALSLGISPQQLMKFQLSPETQFEERFVSLEIDKFEAISEWYHDAILELTRLKCFKADHRWIARTLEININQVNAAVERLISFGLLEINSSGKWVDLSANNSINFDEGYTSSAMKKYQKDILQKSSKAIDELPRELRDHTSLMLVYSKSNMKKAKKVIKEFRSAFSAMAQKSASEDVYVLNVSFFPITNIKKENT